MLHALFPAFLSLLGLITLCNLCDRRHQAEAVRRREGRLEFKQRGPFIVQHMWRDSMGRLLCRYVQLQLRAVGDAHVALDKRLTALEAAGQEAASAGEAPRRGRRFPLRRPHWMNQRAVASGALTVATVAGVGSHPLLRLLGMIPLLYLIPPDENDH